MAWWRELRSWLKQALSDADPRSARDGSEGAPHADATVAAVRPADWNDVLTLMRLLERHGVDYALVGGYALNFNGLVRQTGDVDILVSNTPENNRRWVEALSQLPDGAAAELARDADDPFLGPGTEGYDDEPGVIRIADEFVVDVMPRACGLTLDDLRPHVRRIRLPGGEASILDLEGLRLTKQGVRDKDRADLGHIEAALRALKGQLSDHVEAMARRPLVLAPPPAPEGYEFQSGTPLNTGRRELARAVLAMAARADGDMGLDVETLEVYCDDDVLKAILADRAPISDLREKILSFGVTLPSRGP